MNICDVVFRVIYALIYRRVATLRNFLKNLTHFPEIRIIIFLGFSLLARNLPAENTDVSRRKKNKSRIKAHAL